MEYYLPIMVMLLIQLIYSGLTLGTRIVLLEGLSPMVFVVYRYAFATIFLAPVAYLSGYFTIIDLSLSLFFINSSIIISISLI